VAIYPSTNENKLYAFEIKVDYKLILIDWWINTPKLGKSWVGLIKSLKVIKTKITKQFQFYVKTLYIVLIFYIYFFLTIFLHVFEKCFMIKKKLDQMESINFDHQIIVLRHSIRLENESELLSLV
jgi:hypothetical protein